VCFTPPHGKAYLKLPNEIYALSYLDYYNEQGLIVDKYNGEFAHCPLPKKLGKTGYYLLPEHHIVQGLLQSKDCDRCCFFSADPLKFLINTSWFPDDFFDLWDIYDKYRSWASNQTENREKISKAVSLYIANLSEGQKEARNRKLSESIKKAWGKKDKEERRKHMQKVQSMAPHPGKHVKVIFPDGMVLHFDSMGKAAKEIGVSWMTIRNWAKLGKVPKSGKNKGVIAQFI
jgi:hypothetical protein